MTVLSSEASLNCGVMCCGARARGGRPSRTETERLEERILDEATKLFLSCGYAAASIEAITRNAGTAKRTLYHRYPDKAALFVAVVQRLIARWVAPFPDLEASAADIDTALYLVGKQILSAAGSAEAIALRRVLYAEGPRFPELARLVNSQGVCQGLQVLAGILERESARGGWRFDRPIFAATQFVQMIIAEPTDRMMAGDTDPFAPGDAEQWLRDSVQLFLYGVAGAQRKSYSL
ncbi:TetR/AcrR family transcriptional regulator, mexJK operon transcriptional repressor [Azospirillaceae bacterium]